MCCNHILYWSVVLIRTAISFLHVSNAEYESKEQAEGTNSDVANGQEVVLTSKGISGGQNETLLTLEWSNLVLIINLKLIGTCFETIWDSTPKFSEVWKTSSSHPDNEMLFFHILPLNLWMIFSSWKIFLNVFEFECDIGVPGNLSFSNFNFSAFSILGKITVEFI